MTKGARGALALARKLDQLGYSYVIVPQNCAYGVGFVSDDAEQRFGRLVLDAIGVEPGSGPKAQKMLGEKS